MSSIISFHISPLKTFARSNSNTRKTPNKSNPRKLRINKPKTNPKPNHLSFLNKPSLASEATSYTRLPPKDDFLSGEEDTLLLHQQFADIVKLSESAPPKKVVKNEVIVDNELGFDDDNDNDTDAFDENDGFGDENGVVVDEFEGLDDDFDDLEEYEGKVDQEFEFEEGKAVKFSGGGGLDGFFEGEGEEEEVKEKGVPAVMRCFDRAKVFVKAGDGGNGVVAFRREKFVPLGGPSGGDGGRGGHIYVEVDGSMNSLLPFRNSIHFRAGRGSHGQGSKMAGAKGEDVVVKVAPGTLIREAVKDGVQGEVLLELVHPGQRALLLPGGRGGRGNASFKSGTNKVPRIAENGEEGPEMWLDLELKLVADVGIVGAPNAGKSTLLSVISAAEPSIANYPFTTLLPNLGVVSFGFDTTIVVADLPGLLEGAHRGFGLGHEFLRHTERCSALIHIVDGASEQPEYEYDAVRLELEMFSPEIAEKPFLVAFNKMDLPEAYEKWPSFRKSLEARGIEPFCMSAINRDGTHDVICAANELLKVMRRKEANRKTQGWTYPANLNHVAEMVKKQRNASINEFEISHDSSCNTWHVVGSGLQRFIQMTNWRYYDSEKRLQHILEACGVYKSLKKLGVKESDTVVVGEMEMVWHDSDDSGPTNMRKKSDDAIKWPKMKLRNLCTLLRLHVGAVTQPRLKMKAAHCLLKVSSLIIRQVNRDALPR